MLIIIVLVGLWWYFRGHDPEGASAERIATNAETTVTEANELVSHMREGRGTVGALLMDEEIYDDPFAFRIDRDPNSHLGFGIGEHFCLGAHLARQREPGAQVALQVAALVLTEPRLEREPRKLTESMQ